jgi:hypothetical protein
MLAPTDTSVLKALLALNPEPALVVGGGAAAASGALPLRLVAGLLSEFGERLFVDLAGLNIMRRLAAGSSIDRGGPGPASIEAMNRRSLRCHVCSGLRGPREPQKTCLKCNLAVHQHDCCVPALRKPGEFLCNPCATSCCASCLSRGVLAQCQLRRYVLCERVQPCVHPCWPAHRRPVH